eukprot:gene5616-8946_t
MSSLPPALAARLAKRGILQLYLPLQSTCNLQEDDLLDGWHPVVEVETFCCHIGAIRGDIYFWNIRTDDTQWELPTIETERKLKAERERREKEQRERDQQLADEHDPQEGQDQQYQAHSQWNLNQNAQVQNQDTKSNSRPSFIPNFTASLMPAAPPVMRASSESHPFGIKSPIQNVPFPSPFPFTMRPPLLWGASPQQPQMQVQTQVQQPQVQQTQLQHVQQQPPMLPPALLQQGIRMQYIMPGAPANRPPNVSQLVPSEQTNAYKRPHLETE